MMSASFPSNSLACTSCGACCSSDSTRWAPVSDEDTTPADLVETHPDGVKFMRMQDGHCVALDGTTCSIYASRPVACRLFVIGGTACGRARRRSGRLVPDADCGEG